MRPVATVKIGVVELSQRYRGRIEDRLTQCVNDGLPGVICDVLSTCPDLIEKALEWFRRVSNPRGHVICGDHVAVLIPASSSVTIEVYKLDEYLMAYTPSCYSDVWAYGFDVRVASNVASYVDFLRDLLSWLDNKRNQGLRFPHDDSIRKRAVSAVVEKLGKMPK